MPLTDEQRKKFAAILNEVVVTPNDTKTKRERKDEFEKSFGKTTPTSEIAAKIEAAHAIVWLPYSYVLFARRSTCKACGASERCLDVPQLFLQKRKQQKDDTNPYVYEAVKEMEFTTLPRRIVLQVRTTPFCLECFECPSNSLNSSQAATQSRTEGVVSKHPELVLAAINEIPSPSLSLYSSPSNTKVAEFAISPSETAFGSECGEREFAQLATAEG